MTRFVSQAEKEGVTLAEIIAREMSLEEMELAQDALAAHLSDNYESIRDFMSDVSVPSIAEVMADRATCREDDLALMDVLSDDQAAGEEF